MEWIKHITMSSLTVGTLKKICDKIPDDYEIKVVTIKDKYIYLKDVIEVDISNNTLILKE